MCILTTVRISSRTEAETVRLITYAELKPAKGSPYSREWIAQLVKAGKFPVPVTLSKKRKAWVDEEVDQHIADLASQRKVA
jgi:predicted DNA-binding transcriptional regulator AlpA